MVASSVRISSGCLALLLGVVFAASCSESGRKILGQTCARDEECASSRCDELVCKSSDPLARDAPCSEPYECGSEICGVTPEGGRCGAGTRQTGDPCTHELQCASTLCVAATCSGGDADAGVLPGPDMLEDGALVDGAAPPDAGVDVGAGSDGATRKIEIIIPPYGSWGTGDVSPTDFTEISPASVTFTPSHPSEEWLVFTSGELSAGAFVRAKINGVLFGEGEHHNAGGGISPWISFTRVTSTVREQIVTLEHRGGGLTVTPTIFTLPPGSDFQYASVAQAPVGNVEERVLNLSFVPASAGHYLVVACWDTHDGVSIESSLRQDGVAASWPDPPYRNNDALFHANFLMQKVALVGGAERISLVARASSGGGTVRNARLMAFRLDAFADTAGIFAPMTSITGTTEQSVVSLDIGAGDQKPKVVFLSTAVSRPTAAGPAQFDFVQSDWLYRLHAQYVYELTDTTSNVSFAAVLGHTEVDPASYLIAALSSDGLPVVHRQAASFAVQLW